MRRLAHRLRDFAWDVRHGRPVVLWGRAPHRAIQFGSLQDRRRQEQMRRLAVLARNAHAFGATLSVSVAPLARAMLDAERALASIGERVRQATRGAGR